MNLDIKVTRMNNRFHARLFAGSVLKDEMACDDRRDIGWICREMLRWYDKDGLNEYSPFAAAARKRHQTSRVGNVWYKNKLWEGKDDDSHQK